MKLYFETKSGIKGCIEADNERRAIALKKEWLKENGEEEKK